jgi:sugar phosphate isomerase/epimerase
MSEPVVKKLKKEEFQPRLRSIKTLWGVPESDDPKQWKALFARIKAEGFDAVECCVIWLMPGFMDALTEAGLELVAQLHTTSTVREGWAGFRYNTSCSVQDHLASLKELATDAKKVGAFLINSHSGCDSWSVEDAREFLRGALVIEADLGLPIVHETHRRRLFWNPFNFREILKGQADLADVKINLDISHWVVCLERIFDSPESHQMNGKVDGWWPEVLQMLGARCWLIHVRATVLMPTITLTSLLVLT